MIEIPERTVTGVHEVTPDVSIEWLFEGRAYIATIKSMRKEAIDAFMDMNKQIIYEHPENQIALTVQDGSLAGIAVTGHMRERTTDLWYAIRERGIEGHMAIVTSRNPITSTLMKLFINTSSRFIASDMVPRFFNDRDEAIEFIKSKL